MSVSAPQSSLSSAGFVAEPRPARDLVLAAVLIVGLSRLVDGPAAWVVALTALLAMAFGTIEVLAAGDPRTNATGGVPIEHVIAPAATVVAAVGVVRLVPLGALIILALAITAWLVGRVVATEGRVLASPGGATPADRSAILVELLVIGFLGFTGVAALVPGGLVEPGAGGSPLAGGELALLALADGAIALLLGYRAAALRTTRFREVLLSAVTSGAAITIAAIAIRAMAAPRFAGPALLALVLFLWNSIHEAPAGRRRTARYLWEIALLVLLGIVVIAWGLQLRDA
ncbi:MAG: hypothetical protein L0221_00315 [Chloroflexi bacterium]|nr:hypothetical protein [Chloroflexota bacterium]